MALFASRTFPSIDVRPELVHLTTPKSGRRVIGAEEIKDSGILTTRPEYNEHGIEISNVDNPPTNSEIERHRRRKEDNLTSISLENDIGTEIAPPAIWSPPTRKLDEYDLDAPSHSIPQRSKKKSTKAEEDEDIPQAQPSAKPRRTRAPTTQAPWYPDEHEWMKALISNNLDRTWDWYAEQGRIRFEGTKYFTPESGKPRDKIRGGRTGLGVQRRFSRLKTSQREAQRN